jgi:hypothetical protein
MLVIVVRVRTAADEGAPGGLKVSVTSGECREVHLLAQLLEDAHAHSSRRSPSL